MSFAQTLFNECKGELLKVITEEATEVIMPLDFMAPGLFFRMYKESFDPKTGRMTIRRQFGSAKGTRVDEPKVAAFLKEFTTITREFVADHVDNPTFTKKRICDVCKKDNDDCKWCSVCKNIRYCGRECQTADWKHHKKVCTATKP
jgi:RNA recognition motif-containing protein